MPWGPKWRENQTFCHWYLHYNPSVNATRTSRQEAMTYFPEAVPGNIPRTPQQNIPGPGWHWWRRNYLQLPFHGNVASVCDLSRPPSFQGSGLMLHVRAWLARLFSNHDALIFGYDFLLLRAESSGTTTDRHAIVLSGLIIPLTHSQSIRLTRRDFRSLDYCKILQSSRCHTFNFVKEKFVFLYIYFPSWWFISVQLFGPALIYFTQRPNCPTYE